MKGGWEAYYCDRSAVGGGIPDPHTSLVGDSPNALHTYILYFSQFFPSPRVFTTESDIFVSDLTQLESRHFYKTKSDTYFVHDFFMISNMRPVTIER